jgi:hypothetical protein
MRPPGKSNIYIKIKTTEVNMRRRIRFSVDPEKEKDILEYLDGFPKSFRGEVIVTAIRFFLENIDRYISKKPVDGEKRNTINLDGLRAIGKQFEGV